MKNHWSTILGAGIGSLVLLVTGLILDEWKLVAIAIFIQLLAVALMQLQLSIEEVDLLKQALWEDENEDEDPQAH